MTRPAAARPDVVRRHNLALVLQQVHLDGPLTRAELTQRSGLSRSTIGGLVTELSELRLVQEHVPVGGTRAGRPSHVVSPRPDGPYAVAVDIDVRQMTTAAVGIGGQVLARHLVRTPAGPLRPEELPRHVRAALPVLRAQVGGTARLVGLGISVPGTVGRAGVVELAPNLGWQDVELRRLLVDVAPGGLPVSIGNDADLAVLAEHRRGSARGCDDVVYLLARIGVGAGMIVGGRPLRGSGGLAGELGHTVLDPSGPPCRCGGRGCVETYVGDAALLRMSGGTPGDPDGARDVLRAAAAGEAGALAAVGSLAEALGRAVASVVNLLNPQVVVMGGSLREVLLLAQDRVEQVLDGCALASARAMVHLAPSALGEDAPLLGAAELAFGALLADPLGAAAPPAPLELLEAARA